MTEHDEPIRTSDDKWTGLSRASVYVMEWLGGQPTRGEVVRAFSDNDSAVEVERDSTSSDGFVISSSSLSPSIFDYRIINERTYDSDRWQTKPFRPIDDRWLQAQWLDHEANFCLLKGFHLAPLKDSIERILDVGTSGGYWAYNMADEYPDTEVIGTDLSPIQPTWVPDNLRYEVDDYNLDWTYPVEYFDFVHIRCLTGTINDWTDFFRRAYRCIKPHGHVESHEASFIIKCDNGSIDPESPVARMGNALKKAGEKTGRSFTVADDGTQRTSMEEAGFTIVQDECLKMPIGKWHKDPWLKLAGQIGLDGLCWDLEGYLFYPTSQLLGWEKPEAEILATEVRKQIKEEKMDVYVEHRIVVGQKPRSTYDPGASMPS